MAENESERARQLQLWTAAVQGLSVPVNCAVRGIPNARFATKLLSAAAWNDNADTLIDLLGLRPAGTAPAFLHPDDADLLVRTAGSECFFLPYAAEHGSDSAVVALLHAKVAVNITNGHKSPPLIYTVLRSAQASTVAILLGAKADVTVTDISGKTASHWALTFGHVDIMRQLLEAKADVHGGDPRCAHVARAAGNGDPDMVQLLLGAKADVDLRFVQLTLAVRRRDYGAVRRLVAARADVDGTDYTGATHLQFAAFQGDVRMVRGLLKAKAQVDKLSYGRQETALALAAYSGELTILRLLLEAGASVNHRDSSGRSAVFAAATSGRADSIQQLCAAKADVNLATNGDQVTPLMHAHQSTAAMSQLLQAKADANAMDFEGRTALKRALDFDYDAAVEFLLQFA
jgi:ankyrin repeat protein